MLACKTNFVLALMLFLRKKNLQIESPLQLSQCSTIRMKEKSDLKIHQRVHTNERPYKFDVCEKIFRAIIAIHISKKSLNVGCVFKNTSLQTHCEPKHVCTY